MMDQVGRANPHFENLLYTLPVRLATMVELARFHRSIDVGL